MKEIEIKGNYKNCMGCDFLGHMPYQTWFCSKSGEYIIDIEKCESGRMANINKVKESIEDIFRRWDKI